MKTESDTHMIYLPCKLLDDDECYEEKDIKRRRRCGEKTGVRVPKVFVMNDSVKCACETYIFLILFLFQAASYFGIEYGLTLP